MREREIYGFESASRISSVAAVNYFYYRLYYLSLCGFRFTLSLSISTSQAHFQIRRRYLFLKLLVRPDLIRKLNRTKRSN